MKRIVLTGGGTAGHVTPNLALIPLLKKDGWDIHYIGTADGIERKLIEELPYVTYHSVSSGKLRRYFDWKNFTDPFKVIGGAAQAANLIGKLKPNVVFSKGGFVSVPVVYGAWMHRVPVIMHESDMTPGLANRISLPFAKVLCTTFPEAAAIAGPKGVHTGTPLRAELFKGDRIVGLKACGFHEDKPVLLMTGGSLGAQSVNSALRQALPKLLEHFQVVHLCGKGNLDQTLGNTRGYRQFEYITDNMAHIFAAADLVVSRAGSNTLCELLALHKPTLLIPYPKSASRGDQILNAESFRLHKYSHVLLQEDMTPDSLYEGIIKLYHDRGELICAMRKAPAADGSKQVLEIITKLAK